MNYSACTFLICCAPLVSPAHAESIGQAGGQGVIQRFIPGDPEGGTEDVPFSPKYAFAYRQSESTGLSTWIVLTDSEAPAMELLGEEPRRKWCQEGKGSFVAVKLDSKLAVDLYFLCTAKGHVNTEMVSTANGLHSVVVKFEDKDDALLKGSLTGGEGSCPGEDGVNKYCAQKSDYTFAAPVVR